MRVLSFLVVGVLLVGGCGEGTEEEIQDAGAVETPDRPAPRTSTPRADDPVRTIRFEAASADHVTGVARLYADSAGGAGFRVEVVLDGLGAGDHAWSIVPAPCGEGGAGAAVTLGGTAGGPGAGPPLRAPAEEAPVRGAAHVDHPTVTLAALQDGDYSLRVFEGSGEEAGAVAACADLDGDDNATF